MRKKLIVIKGKDCSGKETQARLLKNALRNEGVRIEHFSYPNYQSPTGKIVSQCYLGREGQGWFPEGADQVDPMVSSLYFAADRKYNIHKITYLLENGVHVIIDRYVYSNMAHQGGKILDDEKRLELYNCLDTLEFSLLKLPKPDVAIFLHVPTEYSLKLMKQNRDKVDEHEQCEEHLYHAEKAYLELSHRYHFYQIECNINHELKSIEEIHEQLLLYVKKELGLS